MTVPVARLETVRIAHARLGRRDDLIQPRRLSEAFLQLGQRHACKFGVTEGKHQRAGLELQQTGQMFVIDHDIRPLCAPARSSQAAGAYDGRGTGVEIANVRSIVSAARCGYLNRGSGKP